MVRTRFEWPYGGRNVFVSVSFTGWSSHYPMILMEGSSTVFQAFCNLAPGYHQYKFLVDGIWQHDVQQSFVTDDYNTVNNTILVREPDPSILNPEALNGGSNMFLDNGILQHVEQMAHILDADLEVLRRQLSILLSRHTAYELLPESGEVSAVDVKLTVKQALNIMCEQAGPQESLKNVARMILENEISTVPIVYSPVQDRSSHQLLHLASLPWILKYICRHFRHSHGSMPLLQQPVYGLPLGTWVAETGRESGRQLKVLRRNDPLSSALNLFMEAQVSSIPIVDDNGSLLDIYSRSDITALAKNGAYSHIRLDQTNMLQALQLGYDVNGVINTHRQCHTCLHSDSFLEIMERLSDQAVRRLVVIEAGSRRVEGIISLGDVFNFLLK